MPNVLGGRTRRITYGKAVLLDNPKAYYPLNELSGTTAYDLSPNAYAGVFTGGVTLGAAAGPVAGGLKVPAFNGSTGYVALATALATALAVGAP